MNKVYRITHIEDKFYLEFHNLYSVSFPVFELRDKQQQIEALNNEKYHLDCFLDESGENLEAFIAYWSFDDYIYIEHLAVNVNLRGKNIGSTILSRFLKSTSKKVILEIDPLVDEISKKRYGFYRKLGFVVNEYEHFHPAYNQAYRPHKLLVLSYPVQIQADRYHVFYDDLCRVVMSGDNLH